MNLYERYMTIAFLTNGLGAFGLRILAGAGLGNVKETQYLAVWYAAGLLLAAGVFLSRKSRPKKKELLIGLGMAVCSLIGQLGMALSLGWGVPGFVVFPVATGGGLVFVVMVGVLVFKERMAPLGYLGIGTGLSALVLLTWPG
jgi:multidrug transporter EmrE-like cation transporter